MAQNRFILSKNKNAYKSWHLVTWHKHMKFTWTIMLIISYLIIAYLKYLQIVLQETYCRYNYLLQKKSQHGCVRWALREHLIPPCYDFDCGGHHTNDMVGQVNSAHADGGPRSPSAHPGPFARPPISMSGNFLAHVSAESPSNISPNPSEVISEVSET